MSRGNKKKRSHKKPTGGSKRRKDAVKSRIEKRSMWKRPAEEQTPVTKTKKVAKSKKGKKALKVKKDKTTTRKTKTKKTKSGLAKRGTLTAALFNLFDKVGVKKVTYSKALATAKAAKKDTAFNTAHFNKYKQRYLDRKASQ